MSYGAPIQVKVNPSPRSPGGAAQTYHAKSFRGSFAWGGSPGEATIVYVGDAPILPGNLVTLQLGAHRFAGLCISETALNSTRGQLRELQFHDLREFLTWDFTFCTFNNPERRLVNGVWVKRYWHIYPWNYDAQIKTFTASPVPAWAMVAAILDGPTIGSPWEWDFTGNNFFPGGVMNAPVFNFDASTGKRLDAALNEISAAGGVVFTLDPRFWNSYRLVWTRKGYGLLPVFPAESDDRRLGVALSGNATNIRVVGDRNKYQVLDLALTPDWAPAWEQFLVVDTLAQDLFDHEKDPASGKAYNAFAGDLEQWRGRYAAKARALEITVAEYAALRDARSRDGDAFRDHRKYAGRSRMDMPAAIYLQSLLFRAFKPDIGGITNADGNFIPLMSLNIADQMLCLVNYDPGSGDMTDDASQLADGNGLVIVKGWQFGQDFFKLVNPERITENFFTADRHWAATGFQIDDSAEDGRFIILDAPAFTSENLLTTIDGLTVLNAQFTLAAPSARAALTFEAERFSYWKGTWPNSSRDRAEYASGLCREMSGTGASNGLPGQLFRIDYQELLFADGATARQQADTIAEALLLCQYFYYAGGYNLKWNPAKPVQTFGTALTNLIDRVDIRIGEDGVMEVVDWTSERLRDHFEPERDLERRTLNNSLFPGQAELKREALDYKRFLAGIKAQPAAVFDLFMKFLTGNFDAATTAQVRLDGGGTVPATGTLHAGTPLFKPATDAGGAAPAGTLATHPPNVDPDVDKVFAGVTIREGEDATKPFQVQTAGVTVARVKGPVAVNDPIGLNPDGYATYAIDGAYFVKGGSCGIALMPIADTSIKLIQVQLGTGGGGSATLAITGEYDPGRTYNLFDVAIISMGANAGTYVYINATSSAGHAPYAGGGIWAQLPMGQLGTWM